MNTKALVAELEIASEAYYNSGTTTMSDYEFDKKVDLLRSIDPNHPFLKKIGFNPIGTVVKHDIPMGSQEKLATFDDFKRWAEKIIDLHKSTGSTEPVFVIEHKIDGCSAAINYVNGELVSGVSRGDGIHGEDITKNIVNFIGVKQKINGFHGSIRCEIVIEREVFKKHVQGGADGQSYKNPRNSVSGISRDHKENKYQKHIRAIYYDVAGVPGVTQNRVGSGFGKQANQFKTEIEKLDKLDSILGIEHITPRQTANTVDEAWAIFKSIELDRPNIPYDIDGIVIRANLLSIQDILGESSDLRPKGQRCIKCSVEGVETKLIGIVLSIGSNGAIIPTGKLEPVEFDGTTISNVLLNNFEEIESLDIAIGDTVFIKKMGGIIPKVINKVSNGAKRKVINVPSHCHCNSAIVKNGVHVFCENPDCDGSATRRLKSWISKMEIKFIGDELLNELYENHGIKDPADLYTIKERDLKNVKRGNGIVGSLATTIIAEIDKTRTPSVQEFIGSLSIPLLGRRQAEIIIKESSGTNNPIITLGDFLSMTEADLLKLPGFKSSKSSSIVDGIKDKLETIKKLLAAGVTPECAKVEKAQENTIDDDEKPLSGRSFVFTGAINKTDSSGKRLTRQMMWDIVNENGGIVNEDVKKAPDGIVAHLVQADPSSVSSKTTKAQKLGVKIISEDDFFKMIS